MNLFSGPSRVPKEEIEILKCFYKPLLASSMLISNGNHIEGLGNKLHPFSGKNCKVTEQCVDKERLFIEVINKPVYYRYFSYSLTHLTISFTCKETQAELLVLGWSFSMHCLNFRI